MGVEPYWYFVKYDNDLNNVLQNLRMQEFQADRYNPVVPFLDFPITTDTPSPGAQHGSIEEALEASEADGTRSILDIEKIADQPDYGVAASFDEGYLQKLYGTNQPTHKMIEEKMDFFEELERGHCIYIIIYKDGKPDELFFAGYSFD